MKVLVSNLYVIVKKKLQKGKKKLETEDENLNEKEKNTRDIYEGFTDTYF